MRNMGYSLLFIAGIKAMNAASCIYFGHFVFQLSAKLFANPLLSMRKVKGKSRRSSCIEKPSAEYIAGKFLGVVLSLVLALIFQICLAIIAYNLKPV